MYSSGTKSWAHYQHPLVKLYFKPYVLTLPAFSFQALSQASSNGQANKQICWLAFLPTSHACMGLHCRPLRAVKRRLSAGWQQFLAGGHQSRHKKSLADIPLLLLACLVLQEEHIPKSKALKTTGYAQLS